MVECIICFKSFKSITPGHLRLHELTVHEYEEKFPDAGIGTLGKGRKMTWGDKVSETMLREGTNKGRIPWNKDQTKETNASLKKLSDKYKGQKKPEHSGRMKKYLRSLSGKKHLKEFSESQKKLWSDPEYRQKMSDAHLGQVAWNKGLTAKDDPRMAKGLAKRTQTRKERYSKEWHSALGRLARSKANFSVRPNKVEALLDEISPDSIKYVGNSKFWVTLADGRKKNPDFKVEGQNKLIEVFGDYWHRDDNPEEIIRDYKKVGFECLVFWESEMKKSIDDVAIKLFEFIN